MSVPYNQQNRASARNHVARTFLKYLENRRLRGLSCSGQDTSLYTIPSVYWYERFKQVLESLHRKCRSAIYTPFISMLQKSRRLSVNAMISTALSKSLAMNPHLYLLCQKRSCPLSEYPAQYTNTRDVYTPPSIITLSSLQSR